MEIFNIHWASLITFNKSTSVFFCLNHVTCILNYRNIPFNIKSVCAYNHWLLHACADQEIFPVRWRGHADKFFSSFTKRVDKIQFLGGPWIPSPLTPFPSRSAHVLLRRVTLNLVWGIDFWFDIKYWYRYMTIKMLLPV